MNRRNFLQLVSAVALSGALGIKPTEHELRRAREDEDRAIRLARMAEDHQVQLEEARRLDELRIEQMNAEFDRELDALARRTNEWYAQNRDFDRAAVEAYDRYWAYMQSRGLEA
jgi:hypothetical protein